MGSNPIMSAFIWLGGATTAAVEQLETYSGQQSPLVATHF